MRLGGALATLAFHRNWEYIRAKVNPHRYPNLPIRKGWPPVRRLELRLLCPSGERHDVFTGLDPYCLYTYVFCSLCSNLE